MGVRLLLAMLVGPLAVALAFLLPGRGAAVGQVTTILTIEPVIGRYGDTVAVVGHLKDADTDGGVPDKLVNFFVNGQFRSATTDAAGRAVLSDLPLGRLAAGTYPEGVQARYDGEFGSTVYEPSTGAAGLTVSKRLLRVTADSVAREYGDPNPATFSYQLENFLPGDDAQVLSSAPVCTTAATVESAAGTYAIDCGGLVAENYEGDYNSPGTLTVTPAPMIIRADDQSRRYGQANPVLTASYIGTWKLADGPGSLDGTLKCTSRNGGIKWAPVGDYAITCAGQTAANYALKYVEGTLRVAPASTPNRTGSWPFIARLVRAPV